MFMIVSLIFSLTFLFFLYKIFPSFSVFNLFLDHFFQFFICIFFDTWSNFSALTCLWIVLRWELFLIVYFSLKCLFTAKKIIESNLLRRRIFLDYLKLLNLIGIDMLNCLLKLLKKYCFWRYTFVSWIVCNLIFMLMLIFKLIIKIIFKNDVIIKFFIELTWRFVSVHFYD